MYTFQIIPSGEILKLQNVLKRRLPKSAHIHNMVIFYLTKFSDEMEFYVWKSKSGNTELDHRTCWILGKYKRPDDYQQFVISIPDKAQEPELTLFASSLRATPAIDWEMNYEFVAIERSMSNKIIEISITKGNCTEFVPCIYYIMDQDYLDETILSETSQTIEFVRTLDSETWLDHLINHWPRVNEKTQLYRTDMAKRCPGVGVLVTNENQEQSIVSSATVNPVGHIGLVTNEAYRNMGYATACFTNLIKMLVDETELYPCTMVNLQNHSSVRVHSKVGFKESHTCDFIFYKN